MKVFQSTKMKYEEESTSNSQKVGFIFQAKEETDSKTGVTTTTLSLNFGFTLGVGLVPKVEINIPFYTETRK